MLHVFQSDQVEDLVATLVYNLEKGAAGLDGVSRTFRRERVVVPNKNLGAYLQFQIAARRGVAANISFETMESFLESLIPERESGPGEAAEVEVLSSQGLKRIVLALLEEEELLGLAAMAPVRRFLAGGRDREGLERRRYQLAARTASIFREYGYSRMEMLEAWRHGEAWLKEGDPVERENEAWQRELWVRIFGAGGILEEIAEREGRRILPLTEIPRYFGHFRDLEEEEADSRGRGEGALVFPESTHIFGFSFLPEFFFRLFSPFRGPDREESIELYVMSPCLEVWDDVQTVDPEDEPPWMASEASSLFAPEESPLALRLWGRPGRDFHRQLLQLTDGDLNAPEELRRPEYTLLQRLQAVIRHRRDARAYREERDLSSGPAEDRKSVRFLACPGVQRECEAIASEIWELVSTQEGLRFNDIAVVVQPRQRGIYQTHLRAAFEQTHGIPHNVIDIDGSRSSAILEAVRLLLELPLGRLRRREMLAILVHPCLQEKFSDGDRDQWLRWCEELNIFHGADGDDFEGTYLEGSDRYTWEQGMKRLVLGSFMTQPGGDEVRVYQGAGQAYLPLETGSGGLEEAATLVMVARGLIEAVKEIRSGVEERSLGEWMVYLQGWIREYLAPVDQRDARALMRMQGELGEIAEGDLFEGRPVGYRTAFEFAMEALGALEEQYGQYLADGVVVSSFRPMRPIPFKVVFVAGLDEGQFPLPEPPDPLDLRNAARLIGDVRRREQDRYMFLETLMSTRARLYLSWVGRDEATGEAREPASVVRELQEMLAPLEEEERFELREVRHPLRRYERRYFPDLYDEEEEWIDASTADRIPPRSQYQPFGAKKEVVKERIWPNHHEEAWREARVEQLRRRLEDSLKERGVQGYHPDLQELREGMEEGSFQRLAERLAWTAPKVEGAKVRGESISLRLRELSAFLDSPIQGSAKVLMGIYDEEEEDLFDADDEPFEAKFLGRLSVVRAVFARALKEDCFDREELSRFLEEALQVEVLAGRLPSGVFLEVEKKKSLAIAEIWCENWVEFRNVRPELNGPRRLVEFGPAGAEIAPGAEGEMANLILKVKVNGEEIPLELYGRVEAIGKDGAATVQTTMTKGEGKLKYFTRAAIEQAALRAAGLTKGPMMTVALPTKPGAKAQKCIRTLSLKTAEEARAYLTEVAEELLSGVHDRFLPVDVADKVLDKLDDEGLDLRGEALKIRDGDPTSRWYSAPRTAYGPVKSWRKMDPPEEEEAREILARRFRIFREPREQ